MNEDIQTAAGAPEPSRLGLLRAVGSIMPPSHPLAASLHNR